jgi:hypothetical protein
MKNIIIPDNNRITASTCPQNHQLVKRRLEAWAQGNGVAGPRQARYDVGVTPFPRLSMPVLRGVTGLARWGAMV